jgi:hypothetical protein
MSLISFIKKISAWVKSLFERIPAEAKTAIHTGVAITERIKAFIGSPVADVVTALIPGQADDAVVAALRTALPELLTQLQLTENCINSTDDNVKVHCGLQTLSTLPNEVKNSFLHSLSILLAQVAADGKITWQDGVFLLEWYYQHQFKPSN